MPIKLNKAICSMLLVCLFTCTIQASAASIDDFTDIPSDHWGREALTWAVDNGVMKGTSATTMEPDRTLSVGEFVPMLQRLVLTDDQRREYDKTMPDFDKQWPDNEIFYAYQAGIVDDRAIGWMDRLERAWDKPISRSKMAIMVDNSLRILGEPALDVEGVYKYIPDWEPGNSPSVMQVYAAGIIVGVDEEGAFDGKGNVTRAMAAAIAQRMVDQSKRQPLDTSVPPPEKPVDTSFVPLTYYEGDGRGQRIPMDGDLYYPAGSDTPIVLERHPTIGVLGWGQVEHFDGYTGCIDSLGGVIKHGTTVFNFDDPTTGGGLIEGPQGWWTASEWDTIRMATKPDYNGKADGETAVDGLWRWRLNRWNWAGPS